MKLKRMLSLAVIAGAFALLACKQDAQAAPADGQASGQQDVAPDFTLPRVNSSKVFQLSKQRGKVVLVDFWATWCGPCRQMTPIIDQLADEYQGKAKIGKLNVDENGQTAMRYQVRGIPTILMFKGGQVVASKVGSVGKADLQKMIDAA